MLAIETQNLVKEFKIFKSRPGLRGAMRDLFNREYRLIRAVDQIDLKVAQGEMVGYIGENGAGKSTTIKMLTGILQPTEGTLRVNGYDPHEEREKFVRTIGVVFGQRSQLWWDIAVQESFRLLQKVYRVPTDVYEAYLDRLITLLEIGSLLDQPVRKLSLGQRMRCELVAALLHQPSLLFLDEPTIGLDVLVKENIRQFLKEINREFGTTVLLTTHDLTDIEALCSRVIMLDKGKIIYDGSIDTLKQIWGSGQRIHFEFAEPWTLADLEKLTGGLPVSWVEQSAIKYTAHFVTEHDSSMNNINHSANVANGRGMSELLARLIPHTSIHKMRMEEASTEEIIRRIYSEEK